jgi:hypothetical protein
MNDRYIDRNVFTLIHEKLIQPQTISAPDFRCLATTLTDYPFLKLYNLFLTFENDGDDVCSDGLPVAFVEDYHNIVIDAFEAAPKDTVRAVHGRVGSILV